jgi:SAM-dependent methyltransferase
MNIIKDVIQNWLLGFGAVQGVLKKYHSTGLNRDPAKVKAVFDFYTSFITVQGKSILELGPGQTLEVLALALEHGASSAAAVDILQYPTPEEISRLSVDFRLYDGRRLPYESGRFDIVWASDVFEHLRHPRVTVEEIHRVLAPGGMLVSRVDLRDHYHLGEETRWLECRRYGGRLWNAMTWNRSSYVNRLLFSEWKKLFAEGGFTEVALLPKRSDVLQAICKDTEYLKNHDPADISIFRFDAVLQKGPVSAPGGLS